MNKDKTLEDKIHIYKLHLALDFGRLFPPPWKMDDSALFFVVLPEQKARNPMSNETGRTRNDILLYSRSASGVLLHPRSLGNPPKKESDVYLS